MRPMPIHFPLPAVYAAAAALAGAGAYFLWPGEPSVAAGLVLSIYLFLSGLMARRRVWVYRIFSVTALACLTFFLVGIQIQNRAVTFWPENLSGEQVWLTGQIVRLETGPARDRMWLENVQVYGIEQEKPFEQIRLSTSSGRLDGFRVGEGVAVQAKVFTPSFAEFAGDIDYRQYAWLNGLSGTGMVWGALEKTVLPAARVSSFELWLEHQRTSLAARLAAPGTASSAVVAALLTGIRSYIPDDVNDAFRRSGLAHLLAISGLHLGLVGGFVFFLSRFVLACWPPFATRYDVKKPAAVAALAASFAYMLLAGATLPTIRAFVMIGLLFAAFMLGRIRHGIRALCVALVLVVWLWPESVVTASFQMSFAAAAALALWVNYREKPLPSQVHLMRGLTYMKLVWATGFVAGLATLPLAAWHFQMVSLSGFFANLLAIPLTGLWIMPALFVSLPLLPAGLAPPVLWIGEHGVTALILLADYAAASWLGGLLIPGEAAFWLALVACGGIGLFVCGRKTAAAVLTVAGLAGVVLFFSHVRVPFDIAYLNDGKTVLVQETPGHVLKVRGTHDSDEEFLLSRFLRRYHLTLTDQPGFAAHCDSAGCLYVFNEKKLLVPSETGSITSEDCALADTLLASHTACPEKEISFKGLAGFYDVGQGRATVFVPNTERIWHRTAKSGNDNGN